MDVIVGVVLYRAAPPTFREALAGLELQGAVVRRLHLHANVLPPDELARVEALLQDSGIPHVVTSSEDNLGFSGGHNLIAAAAFADGADAVLVLNPDLRLDPGALDALATEADSRPLALYGPVLQLGDPASLAPLGRVDSVGVVWTASCRHLDEQQGDPWSPPYPEMSPVAAISGAALLVPRAAYSHLLEVSGELFDESFIAYREDAELGFRAALLGIPSVVVGTATGVHARALRGTQRGGDELIDRLGVRNRFLLAFKYGRSRPGGTWRPLARDLMVLVGVVVRERSSLSGVADAWRLRKRARAAGQQVLARAVASPAQAARLGL